MDVHDVVQVLGALCVLVPFTALQLNRTSPASPWYLSMNALGSAVLAGLAMIESQWGFLLLEGVWMIVACWGLMRPAVRRGAT